LALFLALTASLTASGPLLLPLLAAAAFLAGGQLADDPPASASPRLASAAGTVVAVTHHGHAAVIAAGHQRLLVRLPAPLGLRAGDQLAADGLWSLEEGGPSLRATTARRTSAREAGPRAAAWQVIDRLHRHQELAGSLLLGCGSPPEKGAFRRTGLLHLLAVSGMHLAIAAGLLAWLAREAGLGWSVRLLLLASLLSGYAWLTGGSPATLRALAMVLAILVYDLSGREPAPLGPLSLAALGLILWDPANARDLGFQLSLLAVLGICTLGRDLISLRRHFVPLLPWPLDRPSWRALLWAARMMADGLAVGMAASLATAPLLLLTFGTLAPLSLLTGLLAEPLTTIALWLGLPLLVLGGVWPDGPWEGLYRLNEWALDGVSASIRWADRWSGQMGIPGMDAITMLVLAVLFAAAIAAATARWGDGDR
jgi:ComEC/Rec2-related protein